MPRAKAAPAPETESQPQASVWVFTGPYPLTWTEARDAAGRVIGTVKPGDRRVLPAAPDGNWRLATRQETGEFIETADDDSLRQLGITPLKASETPGALRLPAAADGGEHVHPGTGEQMTAVEHPADGTMSPEISIQA